MQTPSRHTRSATASKRRRFPWIIGMLVSSTLIAILVFVAVTLLILRQQGVTQGINTLTVLSFVVGFVVSLLSLLVSFLQWHHPKAPSAPLEGSTAAGDQWSPPSEVITTPARREGIEQQVPPLSEAQRSQRIDWGEAPHLEQFYGREQELATLSHWIVDDACRLVAILGMGGVGKTSLAATLIEQVQEHFDFLFWRSLHNAPSFKRLLQECLLFISRQQQPFLPEDTDSQISLLIEYFRTARCLLVLDNVESILQAGSLVGQYQEGYEAYGRMLQRIGESKHKSCLLITSREKPLEVALQEGETVATRSLHLKGLKPADGRDILTDKGLQGAEYDWEVLISHYEGNPLALKLVAQVIREIFGGAIPTFLKDGQLFFRDVGDVLEQQMKRLSGLEEEIVYWLAIEREAVTLSELQEDSDHAVSKGELQEALLSLRQRQLIETSATGLTLHHVIMEYLTKRFVDRVYEEIRTGQFLLFARHALLKAQAKDYVRESQRRFVLQPLVQQCLTLFGKEGLEQRFQSLLVNLQQQHDHRPDYVAGNVLNLLIHMGCPLRGYDFSHLVVRQAYLQGVALPEVNFTDANFAKSVFTDSFGSISCVTFSPHGNQLGGGTATGEVRSWDVVTGFPLHTFRGHTGWVWSVAFSPDGKLLASGSGDQTIRLWEVDSGRCLTTLSGHTSMVYSVTFSPSGEELASGSEDQAIRLWEVSSGRCLTTLQNHTGPVRSVAFSPDGKLLASGSTDQTIRLWEVSNGQCLTTLHGHTNWVYSVTFSPDGKTLASGGGDQAIRLWEVSSRQCLIILQSHASMVRSVAFSPDGKTLASGSEDQTVRLWEVSSRQCLIILQGHANWIYSVAFSPDGKLLASGSGDQTIRLWEVDSDRCLTILSGHTSIIRSVAFSPDGKLLASGSTDQTIRLWEVSNGQCLTTLHGHTNWVYSVTFSPDGKTLASGSTDQVIRLWEASSSRCLTTLQNHTGPVRSVAFSPDGKLLASGSYDQTICLWEVDSGRCLTILSGHANLVYSVTFSPDGKTLASGSNDQTVRLWEVSSGRCLTTLHGHANRVSSVAFSPDGKLLASCSSDQTIRLWEVSSGQYLTTLQGHVNLVYALTFSPDGKLLASGNYDGTIDLWDLHTRMWLRTLRSDRPYERMNITQVKGLTEAQKATLKTLGAIEDK